MANVFKSHWNLDKWVADENITETRKEQLDKIEKLYKGCFETLNMFL